MLSEILGPGLLVVGAIALLFLVGSLVALIALALGESLNTEKGGSSKGGLLLGLVALGIGTFFIVLIVGVILAVVKVN